SDVPPYNHSPSLFSDNTLDFSFLLLGWDDETMCDGSTFLTDNSQIEPTISSAIAGVSAPFAASSESDANGTSSPSQPSENRHSLTSSQLPRDSETATLLACSDCPHVPPFRHQHQYK